MNEESNRNKKLAPRAGMGTAGSVQAGNKPKRIAARTLDAIVEQVSSAEPVRKADLQCGDWVLVTTKNSLYTICVLGDDLYSVSGGWFDRKALSPQRTTINGCTWGGSAINPDIVAAPGLFLEFGNQLLKTTRIQEVRVISCGGRQTCN
jgi:hypothetical protein